MGTALPVAVLSQQEVNSKVVMTPMQQHSTALTRWMVCTVAFIAGWAGWLRADAQDFRIVWVVIGEAATPTDKQPVRAGRHLFMASELAKFSLDQVQVSRVQAQPEIHELAIGERFCISSMNLAATAVDGSMVKRAPLSISVRQDHKDVLGLDRRRNDICVRAAKAGDYPIRFTSLLPAADGTTRGAQVFLKVQAEAGSDESQVTNAQD